MRDDWVDLMFKTFAVTIIVAMAASMVAIAFVVLLRSIE